MTKGGWFSAIYQVCSFCTFALFWINQQLIQMVSPPKLQKPVGDIREASVELISVYDVSDF